MRKLLFQLIRKIVAWYIATAVVIVFILLLPCCDESQTAEKAIAQSLKHAARYYKTSFQQPIPSCGECSDLERLLILERANTRAWATIRETLLDGEVNTPYVDVPYIVKDRALTNKLTKASAEYKKNLEESVLGGGYARMKKNWSV